MDRLDVVPEALSLSESHPAMNALKWLFAVMDSLVIFPRFFLIKCLWTMRALMVPNLQMVSVDVLIQITPPLKRRSIRSLRTLRAYIRPLDTVHVVHVTPEMDISMKHFAANFTLDIQLIFVRFQM